MTLNRLRMVSALAAMGVASVVALAARPARGQQPAPTSAADAEVEATPAAAAAADAEAERHATLGQRYLDRGDGQSAVGEFRRAYEVRANPRYLYDIAQSYERIGLDEQARFFYTRYLGAAPDAPDREEVEERLEAIDKRAQLVAPSPAPRLAPTLGSDVIVVPVPAEPARRPLWKRWWAWAALGAVVAGAVVAAFTLDRGGTTSPATALGDKAFY